MTLSEALRNQNVRAFLQMLRYGEGTTGPDGYRTMFGGQLFDNNYVDHPRKAIEASLKGKPITSTAAGAYQFLARTWTALVQQHGFPDFSPQSQDLGAIALIRGRKALEDVIAGRFNQAVGKCAREWASLPGSPYGQPTVSMDKARSLYEAAGGTYDAMHAPIKPIEKDGGKPVAPFLLAALPALLEAVPELVSLFGSGSEISQRNVKAVEAVVDIAKAATGATNEQDLVTRLENDPVAVEQVRDAVQAHWFELTEMGGGIEGARKADAALVATGKPYKSPALLVTLLLMPVIYAAVYAVLFTDGFSDDIRAMATGAIFGGLMTGALSSYWFGTSASSARKTELQAQQ